jgi:hypothetical protein
MNIILDDEIIDMVVVSVRVVGGSKAVLVSKMAFLNVFQDILEVVIVDNFLDIH